MNSLSELAERCEKATGPDRNLDADIMRAVGQGGLKADYQPTPLTGSLDAALTLVNGHGVLITLSEIKGDGMPHCVVGNPETSALFEAVADTMPLAICAAALRAKEAA